MRSCIALFIILVHSVAMGQDWDLINPAYRYNYSDDGTDTISNQIFVTDIDTLGGDGLRYTLNRIGIPCDTCSIALGGLCPGCYVWVDQPQFLQRTTLVQNGEWSFLDPDTVLLKPHAPVGSTWLFSTQANVTATMIAREDSLLWGASDSVAHIALSTADTIIISMEHGILQFPNTAGSALFTAIGVHGPDLGVLLPAPLSYFEYHPGDVLQYSAQGAWHAGNDMFPWAFYSGIQQMAIIGREDSDNGYVAQYLAGHSYSSGPPPYAGFWMTGLSGSFTIDEDVLEDRYHPVTTYPNQITSGGCTYFGDPLDGFERTLALHSTDQDGKHLISSFIRYDQSGRGHSVLASEPVSGHPRLFPLEFWTANGTFKEGVGLLEGGENSYFEPWCQLTFTGAYLSSDTIGSLSDAIYLNGPLSSSDEAQPFHSTLLHLTVGDFLEIPPTSQGTPYRILDLQGRLILSGTLPNEGKVVHTGTLSNGCYLFTMNHEQEQWSQRFTIAR
ncbi:MAG TPA: T9SS type A sorting domain-containing protein [Flavobacteriales bacterium]|nr:T9SS type A sorting domain-containing protein [Flavobacteriales bacterium]